MLTRKRVPELMDDPSLDFSSHAEALRGLERLNLISSSAASLWSVVEPLARLDKSSPLKILDIATGGGDIPTALFKLAEQNGIALEITGADISDSAIEYATNYARKRAAKVKFIRFDAMSDSVDEQYDVVMTNLFTHHLDPPDVRKLLSKMSSSATKMVLVNDLVRSEISYALVWLATRVLSRSAVVQYDGPVSVQGSYTATELKQMATDANLQNIEVRSCSPCRQLLIWRRDD